ncbi:uncharacterized protein DS421_2g46750 [Arachis hypogaea]|nr:uncharacterized protein DS421_2g46750 [Arachis hypogaea]
MLAMMVDYDLCCGLNMLREVNSFGDTCSVEILTIAILVQEIQNPMSHAIECARSLHLPPKSCECVELVYQVGICGEHGRSHLLLHSLLKLVLTMSHTLLLGF